MAENPPQDFVRLSSSLRVLQESDRPLRQSEIRERIGRSKSTAHRRVRRMEEKGLISKEGSGYELTELGEAMAERTTAYVAEVGAAREYEEFLGTVNRTDLPLSSIVDARVTRTSSDNPVAPLIRLAEITSDASEVRVLTNSIAPESFEVGRKMIRDGRQEVEMVVDDRAIRSIQGSEWFGEEVRTDLGTGNLVLWVYKGTVPHQIGVMDGKLCLGAEDEDRMPVAMLETEDEEAVDWAESVFESYRDDAERITASDV
jgi:predicted transcriptional regulator